MHECRARCWHVPPLKKRAFYFKHALPATRTMDDAIRWCTEKWPLLVREAVSCTVRLVTNTWPTWAFALHAGGCTAAVHHVHAAYPRKQRAHVTLRLADHIYSPASNERSVRVSMHDCMYATEAVIRPLRCSCHAIRDAWLRVHSSIKAVSLLVTASCRDVSAHSCSNASDDNGLFSLRNRAHNSAGNFVVGRGAAVTKR